MIHYSQEAEADVDRLFGWLQARNPRAAVRFVETLETALAKIASRPTSYPLASGNAVRKCLMRFGRSVYVIYYVIEGDDQMVVRLWHGRELRA